ncbi:MAG: glycosyltransferase [Bacteroidetes bacterium]|nr:glycosyltransferase [Bacteroidota bacterium]
MLIKLRSELQNLYNEVRYDDALALLEDHLALASSAEEEAEVFYQTAKIQFYLGGYDNAEKAILQALEKNSSNERAVLYYGLILEKKGKYLEAATLLKQLYDTSKEYKHVWDKILSLLKNFETGEQKYFQNGGKNLEKNHPLISILILCYNNVEFTAKCLSALFENTGYANFEVIVVDNASVDSTADLLECYGDKITFVHSQKNLGFVGGNNLAAHYAKGDYFVFLNNDTEPQKEWLTHLYNTFLVHKDAGAAGSMLVFPDGKLQEAGGVIFNDASGWNYGKFQSTQDSKYTFAREVDYCSGASLMVRAEIFKSLGGFDERFAPAYYEDTDLCFSVRKKGYKVYYNPFSIVKHFEGATAGKDVQSGFKKFQVLNAPKFIEKWKHELALQSNPDPQLRYVFSDRNKGKRILIIDDIPPLPDRAAGALRHYHTLKQMLNLGYKVTYVHLMGATFNDESAVKYLGEFRMQGVEFVWFNYEYWWSFRETPQAAEYIQTLIQSLELPLRDYQYVYIAFWHIAAYFIDHIKKLIPQVPVLVDTMDIHFLREQRQAEISKDKKLLESAAKTKKDELALYAKADCITVVTEKDRDELNKYLKEKPVFILTDVHDSKETALSFDERKDLVFVGNFNHNPNEDAVLFFVQSIFPHIKKQIPDCKFYVVGNNPTEKIRQLASQDIIVTGWVPDVKPFIEKCKIEVVPLRFGAGNKGKVGEALSYGLPIVTTEIGAEGMGIINGEHAFVEDEARAFAERVIELYRSPELWNKFSKKGKELITSQYSSTLMRRRLKYIFGYETKTSLTSRRALTQANPPKVSIIIPVYNQFEFTQKCIQSIQQHVHLNYEILIVDDASTDKTKNYFSGGTEQRYFRNEKNIGFPGSVNIGIKNSLGDYIITLNNDTVVTDGLMERMLKLAESDAAVGIVGPMSNRVSGVQLDTNANYQSMEEMNRYAANRQKEHQGKSFAFPRVAFLCTLIKREVIERLGGLDERFAPGNFEDDDFCLRAQLAGYKTVIAQDAFIHHYGSKSFTAEGLEKYQKRLSVNRKIFVDKWGADPDELWLKGKSIRKRNPEFPISSDLFTEHLRRAIIYLDEQEYDTALQNLEAAINYFRKSSRKGFEQIALSDLLNNAANAALMTGDLIKAEKYFRQELDENPGSTNARIGLGDLFFEQKKYSDAEKMYKDALVKDSENRRAKEGLNKVYKAMNQGGKNDIRQEVLAVFRHAEKLTAEKKLNEAIELLTTLLETLPSGGTAEVKSDVCNFLGRCFLALNDLEKAKEYFEVSLQCNGNSSEACAGLGEVFYLAGYDEHAKTMFEWAVKHDAGNSTAVMRLKEIEGQKELVKTSIDS